VMTRIVYQTVADRHEQIVRRMKTR
jgi:hypothetical protein